jgi:hypothetical protein
LIVVHHKALYVCIALRSPLLSWIHFPRESRM